jgi:hypothetical protein
VTVALPRSRRACSHSQGGHAALFAGQTIGHYAPELRLRGVAVAAPATELATLLDDHLTDASGVTIGSYSYAAYQEVYADGYPGLSLDSILTPAGAAATPAMAQLCLFGQYLSVRSLADPLIGKYVAHDPAVTEPWATLLTENTPGAEPIGAPVFVAQEQSDALVRPDATTQYVNRVCGAGEHVTYKQYPGREPRLDRDGGDGRRAAVPRRGAAERPAELDLLTHGARFAGWLRWGAVERDREG